MPFQDSHDLPEFKEWLIRTLEPMCDADPVVMSDYIVALLKHEETMSEEEWKEFISRELVDFLESNSRSFVDKLFETLRTKSFLPAVPATGAAPSLVSSYRPSAATASVPTGPAADQPIAGPSRAATGAQNGVSGDVEMGGAEAESTNVGQPGRRQKCFDYHERGFCMRGANCPYEHDADVLIPTPEMMFAQMGQMTPMGQMPFMQRGRGGFAGRGRGRGRGGGAQIGMGDGHGGPGVPSSGPGAEVYNGQPGFSGQQGPGGPAAGFFPFPMPMSFPAFLANDPRKDFWGSNRPPQEKTSSLVITDIPPAHLSVPAVREYFAQFGEVTNVAIETSSKRALITFSNNREAYHAWKSDEAVFGSRHVKVLWHRPRPGQGAKGQQALEASAGLVANLKKIESGEAGEVQGERNVKLSGPDSRLRDTLAELEARERRTKKETLIAEQKVLLNKAKASDKEEKLRILTRLKEIGKEVEALDNPPPNPAGGKDGDVEMSDKDKLDAELEKHGMESAKGRDQEELLKLNAQLTALRDKASKPSTVSFIIPRKYFAHSCQASTLGIPSPTSRYSPYPGARGSRGRGRARGARGGRGGFSRPMSLDNRSRVVAISGEALRTGEGQNTVREWYENTGGHVEVGEMGLLVRYPNREMAERALALGTKEIPGINGVVRATWHLTDMGGTASGSAEMEMADDHGRRGDGEEDE